MLEKEGLLIVHTGNGKGKTTAALGLGMRAWGQGYKVLIVQFIKGNWKYGELRTAEKLGENFVIRQMGEGFVKNSEVTTQLEHQHAADVAFKMASTELLSEQWDMVILDEINYAINLELVSTEKVLELIACKPSRVHLVLTGRDAVPVIIEKADLVTEMREIKHPLKKGIKAQRGIEF